MPNIGSEDYKNYYKKAELTEWKLEFQEKFVDIMWNYCRPNIDRIPMGQIMKALHGLGQSSIKTPH